MSISISSIRRATSSEWDHIWKNCDYATYFHSREWAELWEAYSGGLIRPAPKLIAFTDGKQVLIPMSYKKILKNLLKEYISSPAGTYGGWISTEQLSSNHANLLIYILNAKSGNIVYRANPYNTMMCDVLNIKGEEDETHVLDLKVGFESIYRMWTGSKSSTARNVRKARKSGIVIKKAERLHEWKAYFKCYEDSLKRWGKNATSRYSWNLFELLYTKRSPHMRLWVAYYNGNIIAGALCFYTRKHVVYWHGAGLERYFNLRPVNLLMHEIIYDACESKYDWFDFNPSGGHAGVRRFKESFHGKALNAPVITVSKKTKKILRFLSKLQIIR